ncbi:hypothetical protein K1719_023896 [Acacia pycnantha]|nr:hypothetical protein K1719_023896 [Acacia pycnantha]
MQIIWVGPPISSPFGERTCNAAQAQFIRVAARLCVPNTEWQVTKEGSYNLKCSRFRPEARIWFHFLCHQLLPTLYTQTISRDRAFLLYCLLEGNQIDVDVLIYEELFAALKSTTGNLWFPALITELCRNAEVIFDTSEERENLPSPISVIVVQRILQKAQPNVPQATPARTSAVPTIDTATEAPMVEYGRRCLYFGETYAKLLSSPA